MTLPKYEELDEAGKENYHRGEQATFDFLAAHPDFPRSQHNSEVLLNYIREHKLNWTVAALEEAAESCAALLSNEEVIEEPAPAPQPQPQPQPAPEPYAGLTKKQIAAMPPEEYREKFKDPQFRAAVDRVMGQRRN